MTTSFGCETTFEGSPATMVNSARATTSQAAIRFMMSLPCLTMASRHSTLVHRHALPAALPHRASRGPGVLRTREHSLPLGTLLCSADTPPSGEHWRSHRTVSEYVGPNVDGRPQVERKLQEHVGGGQEIERHQPQSVVVGVDPERGGVHGANDCHAPSAHRMPADDPRFR